ncbi:MAG: hypothetical protein F6K25_04745 [Okeania sp. SIO2G4]|uniref:hypothetical protein n=1 Tax=unclassified Okeania TaxID=2634635 RepID=UPI0013BA55EF|nr:MULTISPECIES: hypothetical protein [unclassified Okeania]NEP41667.1 hypothetical protein [Okeania sp. SIO2H7]NEP74002.1 hypothetical protein [Okeania sp. SIO2G5]NEP97067.1 hypothetical protein [Okeania sp. SIO2F5]NEQ90075.1 hypothetical protein [Okeania sp. SIO2G4]
MLAQIQTKPAPQQLVASPVQTSQNNNWLYAGTDEAWLYTDYSQAPYNICTEAETTAYKLLYEEDLGCYDWSTPAKTPEQIWREVEEFQASASPDDYDEF